MIIYKGHKINDVKVAVENITATTPSCNLEEIRITSNGTYLPKQGVDGYNKVVVNVTNSGGGSGEYDIVECTNLTITANNVQYNQSTTTINYTAKCTVKDNIAGEVSTCTLYGKAISNDFGQNNTQENRLITISFTYKGVTATTQIIQDCKSGTVTDDYTFAFEFSNAASLDYKLNEKTFTADHSPYSVNIKDLGIGVLTDTSTLFNGKEDFVTKITSFPNTSNVTNMYGMFGKCRNLTSLDLSSFNTSNVTNMGYMFNNCDNVVTLDLSSFDTSKVTNMNEMFSWCDKLQSINLSSFDVRKVTDMSYMFYYSSNLTSLDLSNFHPYSVKNLSYMFEGCRNLSSITLSDFKTSKTTNMSEMFYDCSSLAILDLSSFDTSNVSDIVNMFGNCSSLTTLDLSNWGISSSCRRSNMFINCKELKTIYMRNCLPSTIDIIKSELKRVNISNQVTIITE